MEERNRRIQVHVAQGGSYTDEVFARTLDYDLPLTASGLTPNQLEVAKWIELGNNIVALCFSGKMAKAAKIPKKIVEFIHWAHSLLGH